MAWGWGRCADVQYIRQEFDRPIYENEGDFCAGYVMSGLNTRREPSRGVEHSQFPGKGKVSPMLTVVATRSRSWDPSKYKRKRHDAVCEQTI